MTLVLELLGIDNRKIEGVKVKETIIQNLQDALNVVNRADHKGPGSNAARRALMIMITSKKLTHRNQVRAISDLLKVSLRTVQRYIRKRNMLDMDIENNWV